MKNILRNMFQLQIQNRKGFDFQDFMVAVFLEKYSSNGFTVLRQKKDEGCDGVINTSKTVVACYGPEKNDPRKFTIKAEADFSDYQDNWQALYPNWLFVINQDISPAQLKKIKALKPDAEMMGIKQI